MRVAVNKMEGVTSVEVSLNRGVAVIQLAPQNRVTLEQVRQAIRRNGFTPKDAQVRVRGTVVEDGEHLTLVFPGMGAAFRLVAASQTPGIIGDLEPFRDQVVTLGGRVPETPNAAAGVPPLETHTISKDATH